MDHKLRLIQLSNSIRKKYNFLKHGEADYQLKMERKYKPLLEQQQKKLQQSQSQPLDLKISFDDDIYGIKRKNNGSLFLGDFPVTLNKGFISLQDKSYTCTNGLISLLSMKKPTDYKDEDLKNYKDMLISTGTHLTKKGDRLKCNRSYKYNKIIKPLFSEELIKTPPQISTPSTSNINIEIENSLSRIKNRLAALKVVRKLDLPEADERESNTSGNGLMKVIKGVKSLRGFYWNDPNELVERLILLHASKAAGNTSVYNEILAIEEELREANIIQ